MHHTGKGEHLYKENEGIRPLGLCQFQDKKGLSAPED